jgi:hypothetical protein
MLRKERVPAARDVGLALERFGMLLALLASTLLTLLMVTLAGLAVLTARGSVSLAFMNPYLNELLNEEGAGVVIAFDDTVLAFDRSDNRLDVRLDGVRVADAEGRPLATIPQVGLRIRAASLFERKLEPEQLTLIGPRIRLVRSAEGDIELGFGHAGEASDADVLDTWLGGEWPEVIRTLTQIRVHRADLVVDDRRSGMLWHASRADLALYRGDFGVVLGVNARFDQAGARSSVAVEASYRDADRSTEIAVQFANVEPAVMLERLRIEALEPLRPLAALPATLDGNMTLRLDGDRRLAGLAADVRLALRGRPERVHATVDYGGPAAPARIHLDLTEIAPAVLAGEMSLASLEPLRALEARVSGAVAMRLDADWAVTGLDFALAAGAGRLVLPELYREPLAMQGVEAKGRLEGLSSLAIEKAAVDVGGGKLLRFAGAVEIADAGVGVKGKGSFDRLTVADLRRYWPAGMMANAREWTLGHVESGRFRNVRFAIDGAPGEFDDAPDRADLFVLEFGYEDLTCRYWKPMPAIAEAAGQGRVDAHAFSLTVEKGMLESVAVSEGRVTIDYSVSGTQHAEIDFLGRGQAAAVLAILDREPLGLARDVGIDTSDAGGTAAVRTHLSVPLLADLLARDIDYRASAELSGFALGDLFGVYDVSEGELDLKIARSGIEAAGRMSLDGVPVAMGWRYRFGTAATHPSQFTMDATLDERERRVLGVNLAPYIGGDAEVHVAIARDRAGLIEATGRAGLDEARLELAELEWRKPPGVPAQAEFRFRAGGGDGIEVESFRVTSRDFEAAGRASYAPDRSRIVLDRLRFDEQDLAVDVSLGRDAPTILKLTGRQLDLRPVLAAEPAPDQGKKSDSPRLELEARVERVLVSDRFRLDAVEAKGLRVKDRWAPLQASGRLNGGPEVLVELAPEGKANQKLTVLSTDAGGVFAAADILTGTAAGSFRLEAELPERAGSAPIVGRVIASDFRLTEAPVLTKILSMASVTGLVDVLQGDGIQFAELSIPFRKQGDLIEFEGARAAGPALGVTMAGSIDTARDVIAIEGAVVPAYTLNSALGGIPLIGSLFIGREGEGVFALNYRVSGPVTDPSVAVNPLSVLAPGMLRRLVELFTGPVTTEAPDAGQDLVPRTARP